MISDLLLYETGGGGDLLLRGSDLVAVTGYENAPYLAMFGSRKSWWGNKLIPADRQFASRTEEALHTYPLTSAGRVRIEEAIDADLEFLKKIPGTTFSRTVSVVDANKLSIEININGKQFSYVWNPDEMFLTYQV